MRAIHVLEDVTWPGVRVVVGKAALTLSSIHALYWLVREAHF